MLTVNTLTWYVRVTGSTPVSGSIMKMTKTCSMCKTEKPVSEFHKHSRDGYGPMCKPCKAVYDRKYNTRRLETNKQKKALLKLVVLAFKDRPCADCGIEYPPCILDFDHVSGTKEFDIGFKYHSVAIDRLLDEIMKCEVVCANCHRMRTYRRSSMDRTSACEAEG